MNRRVSPSLAGDVERVLERGSFCYVATHTRHGPHVTPIVFVLSAGRLWVTTSRTSVKALTWRHDDRVSGLVVDGDLAVSFGGRVRTFDLLDASSWGRSVRTAPGLALASARFSQKNARFFAGYAVDANHVPLAWTPPGRVFAELTLERTALVRAREVVRTSGAWGSELAGRERFRATRSAADPFERVPSVVAEALGRRGEGVLAVEGEVGLAVFPAAWAVHGSGLYAATSSDVLALAGRAEPSGPSALVVDRRSAWRARDMVGAMVRGAGSTYLPGRLAAGERSAAEVARAADVEPATSAIVRVEARRIVWWRGWLSGTAVVA